MQMWLRLRVQLRIVNVNQIVANPLPFELKDIAKRHLEGRPTVARIGHNPMADNCSRNDPRFNKVVANGPNAGKKSGNRVTNSTFAFPWFGVAKNEDGVLGEKTGKRVSIKRIERLKECWDPRRCRHTSYLETLGQHFLQPIHDVTRLAFAASFVSRSCSPAYMSCGEITIDTPCPIEYGR